MPNYFLIVIYLLAILFIYIAPLYINIRRDRLVALSFLPILLVAIGVACVMFVSSFFGDTSIIGGISLSIFVFIIFIIFGYLMMFPILVLVAFIVEYLRVYYQYTLISLTLIGAIIGAIIVSIVYTKLEFILGAFISGSVAVLVQYYFTEYKIKKIK